MTAESTSAAQDDPKDDTRPTHEPAWTGTTLRSQTNRDIEWPI